MHVRFLETMSLSVSSVYYPILSALQCFGIGREILKRKSRFKRLINRFLEIFFLILNIILILTGVVEVLTLTSVSHRVLTV